jgi:quinoprotein glucose dehydrogenase
MLRANNDTDPYLRHAGVMGLLGSNNSFAWHEAARDTSAAVRMGALLVMRRREMPDVATFLRDSSTNIVREAARAINDLPIPAALPQLASLTARPLTDEPTLRRMINANFRAGQPEHAGALAAFAAREEAAIPLRIEALEALGNWAKPSGRDRVTGLWRPLVERDGKIAGAVLQRIVPATLRHSSETLRIACIRALTTLGISDVLADVRHLATDTNASPGVRLEALRSLATFNDPLMLEAVHLALADKNEALRREGTKLQAQLKPADAVTQLKAILERGSRGEKQTALQTLATLSNDDADQVLSQWMDKMLARQVPLELQLDVWDAARKRSTPTLAEKMKQYDAARPASDRLRFFREAMAGGDAADGRKIFFERPEASCVRCHKINGEGGDVGPDLTHVAAQKDREYLLESLVFPNATIAAGFETVIVTLKNGAAYAGIIKSENESTLEINSPEEGLLRLKKTDIQSRDKGLSAMPEELGQALSKQDLRDVMEFLSQLK